MERKPVTVTDDQASLIEGAILAGEFSDRSSAVRSCLREYFTTNLAETAALLVAYEELDVDSVGEALGVDRERLANCVASIDEEAAPSDITSYLEEIEAEFTAGSTDDGTDRSETTDGDST